MTQSTSEKVVPSAKQGSFRLDGKTAIVTGGGSGIGRAIGVKFADQGAKIHILDLSLKDAEGTCQQIGAAGGRAEAHVCDVTDQKQVIVSFMHGVFNAEILSSAASPLFGSPVENIPLQAEHHSGR